MDKLLEKEYQSLLSYKQRLLMMRDKIKSKEIVESYDRKIARLQVRIDRYFKK